MRRFFSGLICLFIPATSSRIYKMDKNPIFFLVLVKINILVLFLLKNSIFTPLLNTN